MDNNVASLVNEIAEQHRALSVLVDRYNNSIADEAAQSIERLRPKPNRRVPELERFRDIYDAHEAMQRAFKTPAVRRIVTTTMTVAWCASAWLSLELLQRGASPFTVIMTCVVLLAGFAAVFHGVPLYGNALRRHLREQLRERGVPICVACGYDTRSSTTPRCPECGSFDEQRVTTRSAV